MTYWAFGFGLSYGEDKGTTWFSGMGDWFVGEEGPMQGPVFTTFLFQMSFATTATTIGTKNKRLTCCIGFLIDLYFIPSTFRDFFLF